MIPDALIYDFYCVPKSAWTHSLVEGKQYIHLNAAWHLKDNLIFEFVVSCPISRTASSKAFDLIFYFYDNFLHSKSAWRYF